MTLGVSKQQISVANYKYLSDVIVRTQDICSRDPGITHLLEEAQTKSQSPFTCTSATGDPGTLVLGR